MKKLYIVAVIIFAVGAAQASFPPSVYNVWQDVDDDGYKNIHPGPIQMYIGGETSIDTYNYYFALQFNGPPKNTYSRYNNGGVEPGESESVKSTSMYSENGSVSNLWSSSATTLKNLGTSDHNSSSSNAQTTSIPPPSVIPEPTTLVLFGLGLAGGVVVRRFRKRK
jgi:hypothetical protein